jgi:signal transduction histidine kinase
MPEAPPQGAKPRETDEARVPRPISEPPSRLLAKVSHDLRQPLHALSLLTGALERRVKEPGARDLVTDAGIMIRALQTTFDNLVDLGRLDEGSVQAQPILLTANDLLSPLAAECAHEAGKSNIIFRHVGSSAIIRTDPLLMQRLLRQLLSNALRFAAREDGSRGKVLFGARRCGDRLRLMVADNGIGVPADQRAAIFEPFVQSDEGRAAGGLGLGLAIAERLARLLDVEIRLQSQPGKGSRFWVDVEMEPAAR